MNDARSRTTRTSRRVGLAVVAGAVTASIGLTAAWAVPQQVAANGSAGHAGGSSGSASSQGSTSSSGTTIGSGSSSGTSHASTSGS